MYFSKKKNRVEQKINSETDNAIVKKYIFFVFKDETRTELNNNNRAKGVMKDRQGGRERREGD